MRGLWSPRRMSGRTAEASWEENARRHRDHGGAGRGLLRSFSPIANRMITFPSREDLYSDHDRLSIRGIGKLPMARHNGRVICPVNPDRAKDWPMWEKCVGCGEGLFAGDAF